MSADYEVGYGKPPRHARFRKGQSGNPRGRPKGAANLLTDLREELRERVLVREGGRERRITRQRAVLKRLLDKALKGETAAIARLLDLILRHEATGGDGRAPEAPLAAEERAVLAELERRLLRRPPADPRGDAPPDGDAMAEAGGDAAEAGR